MENNNKDILELLAEEGLVDDDFNAEEFVRLLEEDKKKINTKEHMGRYVYEHKMLRAFIFDPKFPFPEDLDSEPDLLYKLCFNLYVEHFQVLPPYRREEFSYELTAHEGMVVYQMNFPETTCSTECKNGWAVITQKDRYYFTLEHTFRGTFVLCSWDVNERHTNYGDIEPEKALDKVLEIVKNIEK